MFKRSINIISGDPTRETLLLSTEYHCIHVESLAFNFFIIIFIINCIYSVISQRLILMSKVERNMKLLERDTLLYLSSLIPAVAPSHIFTL